MKIRALTNGNEIDVDEGTAQHLIDARIYEAVDGDEPKPKRRVKSEPKKAE